MRAAKHPFATPLRQGLPGRAAHAQEQRADGGDGGRRSSRAAQQESESRTTNEGSTPGGAVAIERSLAARSQRFGKECGEAHAALGRAEARSVRAARAGSATGIEPSYRHADVGFEDTLLLSIMAKGHAHRQPLTRALSACACSAT